MTIPAPLPAPTTTAIDEAAGPYVTGYMLEQFQNNASPPPSPPLSLRCVVVAWTRHDGTLGFTQPGQLDPTASWQDTVTCRGLADEYGAVVLRVYEWTAALPTLTDVTAGDVVQAAANDAASWVAPQ